MRKQPESYLNSENRYIFHLKTMYKGDFLKLTAMPRWGLIITLSSPIVCAFGATLWAIVFSLLRSLAHAFKFVVHALAGPKK